MSAYETDLYAWAQEQAEMLRQRCDAALEAVAETGLPSATFPEACPWTVEQVLDGGFWPG